MKKKLLFKLFIFAVIGAFVTVTSCKDYDDDISRLEEQSATKTALEAAIAELNSIKTQIAALPTDGDVATTVAAAKTEAINAAVAAATEAVNSATADLEEELEDSLLSQDAIHTSHNESLGLVCPNISDD